MLQGQINTGIGRMEHYICDTLCLLICLSAMYVVQHWMAGQWSGQVLFQPGKNVILVLFWQEQKNHENVARMVRLWDLHYFVNFIMYSHWTSKSASYKCNCTLVFWKQNINNCLLPNEAVTQPKVSILMITKAHQWTWSKPAVTILMVSSHFLLNVCFKSFPQKLYMHTLSPQS